MVSTFKTRACGVGVYTNGYVLSRVQKIQKEEMENIIEEEGLRLLDQYYQLLDNDFFNLLKTDGIDELLSLITSNKNEIIVKRERQSGKSTILAYYMSIIVTLSRRSILFVAPNQHLLQIVVPIIRETNLLPVKYSEGTFTYENGSIIKLFHEIAGIPYIRSHYDIIVIDEETHMPDAVREAIQNNELSYSNKVSSVTIEPNEEKEEDDAWI